MGPGIILSYLLQVLYVGFTNPFAEPCQSGINSAEGPHSSFSLTSGSVRLILHLQASTGSLTRKKGIHDFSAL